MKHRKQTMKHRDEEDIFVFQAFCCLLVVAIIMVSMVIIYF